MSGLPIKVFMPLEGFFRQYEGARHKEHPEKLEYNLVPSDVFVHGYKKIGTLFGQFDSVYHCDSDYYDGSLNNVRGKMPTKLGSSDMWWNETELLKFASECCLVKYPGCFRSNITDLGANLTDSNICMNSRCMADPKGTSGVGFRDTDRCQLAAAVPD